jgi:hypothetical protein
VFGDVIGLSGEREATEQISLVIMLCTFVISSTFCIFSENKQEVVVYAGYIYLSYSIYISEIGIVTPKARPLMGVLALCWLLAGLIRCRGKNRVTITLLTVGVVALGVSMSVDFLLDGVFGYFGKGSQARDFYLGYLTIDLEEIAEPAGYLMIIYSCAHFSKSKEYSLFDTKSYTELAILFSSTTVSIGHTYLVFSRSRNETLLSLLLVYVGSFMIIYYFYYKISHINIDSYLSVSILTVYIIYFILIPSFQNNSDIISILIILPSTLFLALGVIYLHPQHIQKVTK